MQVLTSTFRDEGALKLRRLINCLLLRAGLLEKKRVVKSDVDDCTERGNASEDLPARLLTKHAPRSNRLIWITALAQISAVIPQNDPDPYHRPISAPSLNDCDVSVSWILRIFDDVIALMQQEDLHTTLFYNEG